jgi:uncharacterized protein
MRHPITLFQPAKRTKKNQGMTEFKTNNLKGARMTRLPHFLSMMTAVTVIAACSQDPAATVRPTQGIAPSQGRASYDSAGMHRQYGTPVKVGNGMARTYIVLNSKDGQAPVELGIALDAAALDGLPTGMTPQEFDLSFPQHAPAPYTFAELDWNPQGHVPPGVYTVPHFDFHFYTMSLSERNSIVPSDPDFAAKARNVPTAAQVPQFYIVAGDPAEVAVPRMGVHWSDVRSPELQNLLGHPELYQPFTRTFIYGSWNGRFTFFEPMVTREYLLSDPSDVADIPVPAEYPSPGFYPTAYRVTYDAQANEYRIALSGLVQRR